MSAYIQVTQEQLDDAQAFSEALNHWWLATPEQRAEWAHEAAAKRAEERAAASSSALTLEALLDAAGWSLEYAEHLVQPYCTCGPGPDGWDFCAHASDLGLDERGA